MSLFGLWTWLFFLGIEDLRLSIYGPKGYVVNVWPTIYNNALIKIVVSIHGVKRQPNVLHVLCCHIDEHCQTLKLLSMNARVIFCLVRINELTFNLSNWFYCHQVKLKLYIGS